MVVERLWAECDGVVGAFVGGTSEERRVAALIVSINIRVWTLILEVAVELNTGRRTLVGSAVVARAAVRGISLITV